MLKKFFNKKMIVTLSILTFFMLILSSMIFYLNKYTNKIKQDEKSTTSTSHDNSTLIKNSKIETQCNFLAEFGECKRDLENFKNDYANFKNSFYTNNEAFNNSIKLLNSIKKHEQNAADLAENFEKINGETIIKNTDEKSYKNLINRKFSNKITNNLMTTLVNFHNNEKIVNEEIEKLNETLHKIKNSLIENITNVLFKQNQKINPNENLKMKILLQQNVATYNDAITIHIVNLENIEPCKIYAVSLGYFNPNLAKTLNAVDEKNCNLTLQIINPQNNEIIFASNLNAETMLETMKMNRDELIEKLQKENESKPQLSNEEIIQMAEKSNFKIVNNTELYKNFHLDDNQEYIFKIYDTSTEKEVIKFNFSTKNMTEISPKEFYNIANMFV